MEISTAVGGLFGLVSIVSLCLVIALLFKVNYLVMKMQKHFGNVPKMENPPPMPPKQDRKGNIKSPPNISKDAIAPPPPPLPKRGGWEVVDTSTPISKR